jgi:hypothetical protein
MRGRVESRAWRTAKKNAVVVMFKRQFRSVSIVPDLDSPDSMKVGRRFYPRCEPDAKFLGDKFPHGNVESDRSIADWLTSKRELPPDVLYTYLAYLNARTRARVKNKIHWLAIKRVAKRASQKAQADRAASEANRKKSFEAETEQRRLTGIGKQKELRQAEQPAFGCNLRSEEYARWSALESCSLKDSASFLFGAIAKAGLATGRAKTWDWRALIGTTLLNAPRMLVGS